MSDYMHFKPADEATLQKYNGNLDRILEFGGKFDVLQEAARARAAFRKAHAAEPFENDLYLSNLPSTIARMSMNPEYIERFLELVRCYVEISYDHGTAREAAEITARRQRARDFIAEMEIANQVYEEVQQTEFEIDLFLLGEEGMGDAA